MITETASKQNARRKTLSGGFMDRNTNRRATRKKLKSRKRKTARHDRISRSIVRRSRESQRSDYNTTRRRRYTYSRADLKRRKANKRKIKK